MIAYYLVLREYGSKHREERTAKEMKKLTFNVSPFVGYRVYSGEHGCSKGHLHMLLEAYRAQQDLLVFEDDVEILDVEGMEKQLNDALNDDYVDILYLGYHPPIGTNRIIGETEKWYRIHGLTGTHAILYRMKAIKHLISVMNFEGVATVNKWADPNIDNVIRDNMHKRFNCVMGKKPCVSIYPEISTRTFKPIFGGKPHTPRILQGFKDMEEKWKKSLN